MNRFYKYSAWIVTAMVVTPSPSVAQSVDMRQYWPSNSYLVQKWRNYEGKLYTKRVTKPNADVMMYWYPDKSGDRYAREDHYPIEYGSEITCYHSTWGMRKGVGADKSVIETGDAFPPLPRPCSLTSDTWWIGGGSGQYYGSTGRSGIFQGKASGNNVGEPWYTESDVATYFTASRETTAPTFNPGIKVWSSHRVLAVWPNYSPTYGRKTDGTWGGLIASGFSNVSPSQVRYNNVVELLFVHGVKAPNQAQTDPCVSTGSRPPNFNYKPGYITFWQKVYLAPGVGVVQEETMFDERPDGLNCKGTEDLTSPAYLKLYWTNYFDQ